MKAEFYYDGPVNEDLDNAIEKAVESFGLKRWASGFNFLEKRRDLAFDEEKDVSLERGIFPGSCPKRKLFGAESAKKKE